MKKVLRFLFILILILFVGYLILCATSPKEVNVEKTTTIDAPANLVWSQIGHYEHWESWSPWKEGDSTVSSTVTGPSGEAGNKYEWTSESSGSGYMTIASTEGYSMKYDMQFTAPFESSADGHVKVEQTDSGTKTTWGFHTTVPFMRRGFFALVMQKQLEASFERGLELLKKRIESGEAKITYEIKESTFPQATYAAVRKVIPISEVGQHYEADIAEVKEKAGDKIQGKPTSIYFTWDEEKKETDYATGYAVSERVRGLQNIDMPESKCYMITMKGPYSNLYPAHMQLYYHTKEMNVTHMIEEYVTGMNDEADSMSYVTNIYYIIQ